MAGLKAAPLGIVVPVEVVVDDQSPMAPDVAGFATAERIPEVRVQVVQGACHWPSLDRPGAGSGGAPEVHPAGIPRGLGRGCGRNRADSAGWFDGGQRVTLVGPLFG
ncbi:MAG: hypothetical protein ACRDJU_00310, partial [Actinomycetota bacterium]